MVDRNHDKRNRDTDDSEESLEADGSGSRSRGGRSAPEGEQSSHDPGVEFESDEGGSRGLISSAREALDTMGWIELSFEDGIGALREEDEVLESLKTPTKKDGLAVVRDTAASDDGGGGSSPGIGLTLEEWGKRLADERDEDKDDYAGYVTRNDLHHELDRAGVIAQLDAAVGEGSATPIRVFRSVAEEVEESLHGRFNLGSIDPRVKTALAYQGNSIEQGEEPNGLHAWFVGIVHNYAAFDAVKAVTTHCGTPREDDDEWVYDLEFGPDGVDDDDTPLLYGRSGNRYVEYGLRLDFEFENLSAYRREDLESALRRESLKTVIGPALVQEYQSYLESIDSLSEDVESAAEQEEKTSLDALLPRYFQDTAVDETTNHAHTAILFQTK